VAASVDQKIAALARRQHGNVTREQLLSLRLGPAAVSYRVRTGRLHRAHAGVYAVGRPPSTALERASAAVLACGPGAALSHQSALTLWGLQSRWQGPMHVILGTERRRPGIVTHQARGLTRRDIRTELGIRVTSPARTVLDCAPSLPDKRLTRIVNDGRRSGKLKLKELDDVRRRFPNHPGAQRLAELIDASTGAPTRSEFEDAFLEFCKRFALPRPQINTTVRGHEVDALFAAERVIVELDGWDYHQGRAAFEVDRLRDADALEFELVTLRLTWERMNGAPAREAERLRRILAQRAS
jgi:predicted transcriptional regulator of viral defense system